MNINERAEYLRNAYLSKPNVNYTTEEMWYYYAEGWQKNGGCILSRTRRTMAKKYMFDHMTPSIGRYELIVGKPNREVKITQSQREYAEKIYSLIPGTPGQASHMALDYEKLLDKGTAGVAAEIREKLDKLDTLKNPGDLSKQAFYMDALAMLEALEDLAARYSEKAAEMSKAAETEQEKNELIQIAENLKVVPKYPAQTFWQALQSVQFLLFPLEGLYQYGRPDQYLLRFYENDIKSGILTKERAQELINCACMMTNECIARGLAVGLMVGGRYPDGTAVVNDLTYMYVRSVLYTRLIYPGIGLCVTKDTPDDLLKQAVDALAQGCTHPALFNDEVIVKGLMHYGLPFEEAVSYTHSTCVEITPIKRSGVWVASPYYNLLEPLLRIMGAYEGSRCADIESYEDLIDRYKAELRKRIEKNVNEINLMQLERHDTGAFALVSCFVDDCIERGSDVDQGGARYNFIESSFVGLSNLCDALGAVKALVFEQKKLTLEQFGRICRENYAGNESLRSYILNKLPKYGNDDPQADEFFGEMSRWIADEMTRYSTVYGDRYIPSMFCWIMHEAFGSQTPASPDGRVCGFPLGDGSGPAQGREINGPTASVLSSTGWAHEKFIGGIAVNLKFTRNTMSPSAYDKMLTLIRTYMSRGGFELQINCVNPDELRDAKLHPELHRDLVVRIGGYSDYFTNLPEGMQDEVITRTAHEI